MQQAFAHQIQRDHETTDPTIAVQERVDGFELIVTDGDANQVRDGNGLVGARKLPDRSSDRAPRRDEGECQDHRSAWGPRSNSGYGGIHQASCPRRGLLRTSVRTGFSQSKRFESGNVSSRSIARFMALM